MRSALLFQRFACILVLFCVILVNPSSVAKALAKQESQGVCKDIQVKSKSSRKVAIAGHHVDIDIQLHASSDIKSSSQADIQLKLPDGVTFLPKRGSHTKQPVLR